MRSSRLTRTGLSVLGAVLGLAVSASLPVSAHAAAPTAAPCLTGGAPVSAAAAVGSGAAVGGVLDHGRRKGSDARSGQDTPTLTPAQRSAGEKRIAQATKERSGRRAGTIEVPVYFNILRSGDPRWKNYYASLTSLASTINVLNQTYASAGFHFTQASYRYWNQTAWYRVVPDTQADRDMRRTLHKGGKNALNLYMVYPADGTLGWSSLPQYGLDGANLLQDGVAIDIGTPPGGRITNYNQGKTAVHEVGHWLSLFHTFDGYGYYRSGGCDPNAGDGVSDTPAEYSPTSGCPSYRDSCPAAGLDPIHNYMDYSNDPCMSEFTPGQQQRMQSAWSAFRAS